MIFCTFSLVDLPTLGELFITRETVRLDTPAILATSFIVEFLSRVSFICSVFLGYDGRGASYRAFRVL